MESKTFPKFKQEVQQMMYVSGETVEPSTETLTMMEEIIRNQVVEMLSTANELAARRGSRFISNNDLIFQIRHDSPKVTRLRSYLAWKDVRKTANDSDDKTGDADVPVVEESIDVAAMSGSVDNSAKQNKKAKVGLPWETASLYTQSILELDEAVEDEDETNVVALERLRKADERTKGMTKEQYIMWTEYRHSSFTWRKIKRFREWAGLGVIAECKPTEDVVEILGFLIVEWVQMLTEKALKFKEHEDNLGKNNGGQNYDAVSGNKRKLMDQGGLFDPPIDGRTPVEPKHIQQAFTSLQVRPNKTRAMLNGTKLQRKANLKLVSIIQR